MSAFLFTLTLIAAIFTSSFGITLVSIFLLSSPFCSFILGHVFIFFLSLFSCFPVKYSHRAPYSQLFDTLIFRSSSLIILNLNAYKAHSSIIEFLIHSSSIGYALQSFPLNIELYCSPCSHVDKAPNMLLHSSYNIILITCSIFIFYFCHFSYSSCRLLLKFPAIFHLLYAVLFIFHAVFFFSFSFFMPFFYFYFTCRFSIFLFHAVFLFLF